jgi:hypothetical protein
MTLEHDLLQLARDAIRSLISGRDFAVGQTGHYLNIISRIEAELSRPKSEPTPVAWAVLRPDGRVKMLSHQQGVEVDLKWTPLYTAPPRKTWQGLTSEDWENTPDTGKQGCERDAELFDWIEQTLKDKNDTF